MVASVTHCASQASPAGDPPATRTARVFPKRRGRRLSAPSQRMKVERAHRHHSLVMRKSVSNTSALASPITRPRRHSVFLSALKVPRMVAGGVAVKKRIRDSTTGPSVPETNNFQ